MPVSDELDLSIVLPVYNQADHIARVVDDLRRSLLSLDQLRFELIVVSNGCRDDSPQICRQLATQFSDVRAIDSSRGGWGLAVKLGLSQAHGRWIGYTNSARTTGAQLLQVVRRALAAPEKLAVVKARRHHRSLVRGMGSALYNLECRALFGMNWADVNGTPKLFPRVFDRLLHLSRDDDLIDAEFSWVCRREDYPVIEEPIAASERHGGESTTRFKSAWRMYRGAFLLRWGGLPSTNGERAGAR